MVCRRYYNFTSLPFQQCKHHISTVDCQPSGSASGMLVFVSGNLQLAGEEHALKFSQMFHLMPTPQGSFYVFNDIFRCFQVTTNMSAIRSLPSYYKKFAKEALVYKFAKEAHIKLFMGLKR